MVTAGLSLCMIVKNESEFIEQAILSAKPFVQEIVVVDTGSTDQTPVLAENLGAKVFKKEWNDNFSEMRNYSIEMATQRFILVMDADEMIIEGNTEALQRLCEKIEGNPGSAGTITILNETMSGDTSSTTIIRIFPRDEPYRYTGKIHEQLTFLGKPIQLVVDSQIQVNHLGYSALQMTKKNKYERNLALLLSELSEHPDPSYIQFQIGRTFYVMKDYVQAEHFLNKCIETELQSSRRNFLSSALLTMGYCCIPLQKFNALSEYYKLAIDLYPDYTDLYFMYGVGLIESRDIHAFKEIPDVFKKCTEMGEASSIKYETVKGVGSFKAHYNLALFYELTSQLKKAVHHYQLSSRDGYTQAKERLRRLLH